MTKPITPNHSRRIIIVLLILWGSVGPSTIQAQERKGGNWFVLPVIFSSPETSWGFGASVMHYFRTDTMAVTKPSNLNLVFIYTLENQMLIEFPIELFLQENKTWLSFQARYYVYPFKYYGSGNGIDLEVSDDFDATFISLEGRGLRNLGGSNYFGARFNFREYIDINRTTENGVLLDSTYGYRSGTVSGVGLVFIQDQRDNVFSPRSGHYIETNVMTYGAYVASDYSFTDVSLDVRKYFNSGDFEFGLQFYQNSLGGKIPFYNLARMGGSSLMRGYFTGAYRDKHYTTFQAEARYEVFRWLVLSSFGSIGSVSSSFMSDQTWRSAMGIGARYVLDPRERIRIRFDYAFGKGTSGFYININEAF